MEGGGDLGGGGPRQRRGGELELNRDAKDNREDGKEEKRTYEGRKRRTTKILLFYCDRSPTCICRK